jgi:hypothetical protein
MKLAMLVTRIAVTSSVLMLANAGSAQTLSNTTNFPMIGIVRGQTLQLNLVAIPTDPCFAQLGFRDSNGAAVGPTLNVMLQPGQSASLTLNGHTLTNVAGQRVEVLPTVILTPGAALGQCTASAEVYDDVLGISTVVVPGTAGFPSVPEFGMFGLTALQTARLNVVAYPSQACVAQLGFVNANGVPVGNTISVQLAPGQAASLDLPGSALVTKLGQRSEVQPVVSAPNGGCVPSAEVYLNGLGATSTFIPIDPCSPSNGICTAF